MDLKYASDSDLEIFSKTFEKLNIPKCNLKMEENPTIEAAVNLWKLLQWISLNHPTQQDLDLDTLELLRLGEQLMFMIQYSPMDHLRPEGINPFGIYLDLDCNPDISSTLDKWETSL